MEMRDEGMNPKTKLILAIGGILVAVGLFTTLILVVAIGDDKTKTDSSSNGPKTLPQAMSVDDMMTTLEEFQNIAYAHNGSRTAITGYNASVAYVVEQLEKNTNYNVTQQYFTFLYFQELAVPVFQQTEPTELRYINNVDFRNLRYGGSGNVTAPVAYVGGGCNNSDYTGFTPGYIALMARNYLTDCSLQEKIDMAESKGAVGVLVYYDPGTTGLFGSGLKELSTFPAFSLTYDLGQFFIELINENPLIVNMYALTEAPPVVTINILADTTTGDPTSTIVVGSHLDSVPAGPGINDNGSGSSVNLEMAIQLHKLGVKLKNRVRFAWWAAEEFGLLGSTYYVGSLTSQEKSEIALNLNFDMMGSPNYFRGIYNGTGASQDIRKGCEFLTNMFEEWFATEGLFYDLTPFTGRSDYGPFISNGIPAGGLDTGAEKIKTPEQRSRYGGLANTAFDPCYHLVCDTVENINQVALRDMSQAAANGLEYLATLENLRSYLV